MVAVAVLGVVVVPTLVVAAVAVVAFSKTRCISLLVHTRLMLVLVEHLVATQVKAVVALHRSSTLMLAVAVAVVEQMELLVTWVARLVVARMVLLVV